jgi:ureidoglycolate lyase
MRLPLLPPDAALFAPFGAFIDRPTQLGERRVYSEWLAPVEGLRLQCHTNRVAPSALPCTLDRVERHPHAAQMFLPLDVSRYVVTVMAANSAGAPDPASARAFVLPPTLGVVYRAGVWHAGMTVLDAEAGFAVLMWRGAIDDDVFAAIPPVELTAATSSNQPGGARG